jgi:hypothetical protein
MDNTSANVTSTSLTVPSQSGHSLPLSVQAAALLSLTRIETASSEAGSPVSNEVTAGLLAIVLALLTERLMSGDAKFVILSRAERLATELGVSEEVWNTVFSHLEDTV